MVNRMENRRWKQYTHFSLDKSLPQKFTVIALSQEVVLRNKIWIQFTVIAENVSTLAQINIKSRPPAYLVISLIMLQ